MTYYCHMNLHIMCCTPKINLKIPVYCCTRSIIPQRNFNLYSAPGHFTGSGPRKYSTTKPSTRCQNQLVFLRFCGDFLFQVSQGWMSNVVMTLNFKSTFMFLFVLRFLVVFVMSSDLSKLHLALYLVLPAFLRV